MPFVTDSLTRRTTGPALASAIVGAGLGVVAIFGIATFSTSDSVPQGHAVPADQAIQGGPEYGSRGE